MVFQIPSDSSAIYMTLLVFVTFFVIFAALQRDIFLGNKCCIAEGIYIMFVFFYFFFDLSCALRYFFVIFAALQRDMRTILRT